MDAAATDAAVVPPTEPARPVPVETAASSVPNELSSLAADAPPPRSAETTSSTGVSSALKEAVRPALALLANVTVVTALLVYFGWRRAETQADRLGIDESILGMSTREYLLRSVGPVLTLLVLIGAGGLAWISMEPRLTLWLRAAKASPVGGVAPPAAGRIAKHLLGVAWIILPAIVILVGYLWPALAFVAFPLSIGTGVLLWLYARSVLSAARDGRRRFSSTTGLAGLFAGLLVLVCLFWTASNYAEVLGRRLADDLAGDIEGLPGVTVLSEARLHLDGPGVQETELADDAGFRYRYRGLRLLEHTGGNFLLVSDGWSTEYGVVFLIGDDDESLRLDFVRDDR